MKRIFACLTLLCLALGLLSACARQEQTPTGTQPAADGGQVILYHTLDRKQEAYLSGLLAEKGSASVQLMPWDGQSQGKAPGLLLCSVDDAQQYRREGSLQELTQLATHESMGLTQAQQQAYDGYCFAGTEELYSLPVMRCGLMLFYNRSYFEIHGIPLPDTWERLEQTCRLLKEQDPDCVPLINGAGADLLLTLCRQEQIAVTDGAGKLSCLEDPQTAALLQELAAWSEKGWLVQKSSAEEAVQTWKLGSSYMAIAPADAAAGFAAEQIDGVYPYELGIALLPQRADHVAGVAAQGLELGILKSDDTAFLEAAWQVAKQLSCEASVQAVLPGALGGIPVLNTAGMEPDYQAYIANADGGANADRLAVKTGYEQRVIYFTAPITARERQRLDKLVQTCLGGGADIAAAIAAAK